MKPVVVEGKGGVGLEREADALHLGGVMKVCLSQEQANEVLDLCNSITEDVPCMVEGDGSDENCIHCQAHRIATYLTEGGLRLRRYVGEEIL